MCLIIVPTLDPYMHANWWYFCPADQLVNIKLGELGHICKLADLYYLAATQLVCLIILPTLGTYKGANWCFQASLHKWSPRNHSMLNVM